MTDVLGALRLLVRGSTPSTRAAAGLLESLGADVVRVPGTGQALIDRDLSAEGVAVALGEACPGGHDGASVVDVAPDREAEVEWATSGLAHLTGSADGPPVIVSGDLLYRVRGSAAALDALGQVCGAAALGLDGPELLGERAAAMGLRRRGAVSPGGSCRMVATADGHVAVNLARPEDADSVPALLGCNMPAGPWTSLQRAAASTPTEELVERAFLLGLPLAAVVEPGAAGSDPQAAHRGQGRQWAPFLVDDLPALPPRHAGLRPKVRRSSLRPRRLPVVIDLSSLWAGPLCTHLLQRLGARVLKVESAHRPDGARRGPSRFYELLNGGKEEVVLDLRTSAGRSELIDLIDRADVLVEASRPRALEQLGVNPASAIERNPGLSWVSITGYGRTGPWRNRVAFGDDAAAAAGLVLSRPNGNPPWFVGDAVADPIAGLYAALGAMASFVAGGGHVIDVAMREAVAHAAGESGMTESAAEVSRADSGCVLHWMGSEILLARPRLRS